MEKGETGIRSFTKRLKQLQGTVKRRHTLLAGGSQLFSLKHTDGKAAKRQELSGKKSRKNCTILMKVWMMLDLKEK